MNIKWNLLTLCIFLSFLCQSKLEGGEQSLQSRISVPTALAYETFNGIWEGKGIYNGHNLLKEECDKMTLDIKITDYVASIRYHFVCESFEFIDDINMEKMSQTNIFLQKDSKVGSITHDKQGQKFLLILDNVQFTYFNRPLNVRIKLNTLSETIEYSDLLTYSGGGTDSFKVILRKQ